MFLGGQLFENAASAEMVVPATNRDRSQNNANTITYHGKPVEIKDRLNRFRATDENIWNNPYRATSNKIRSFYHAKDQEFKRKLLFYLKLRTAHSLFHYCRDPLN